MIRATVDTSGLKNVQAKLNSYKDMSAEGTDKMLRSVATSLCAVIRTRVHEEGIKSNGQLIGVYSESYLKTRQKYNWGASKKIILSLTSPGMRNDFGLGATSPTKLSGGGYGLGFKNPTNAEKHEHLKERYGNIYNTTSEEKTLAGKIASRHVKMDLDA